MITELHRRALARMRRASVLQLQCPHPNGGSQLCGKSLLGRLLAPQSWHVYTRPLKQPVSERGFVKECPACHRPVEIMIHITSP